MNNTIRQMMYFIFIVCFSFVNYWLEWMSIYQYMIIIIGAGIIMKLTDIEDKI